MSKTVWRITPYSGYDIPSLEQWLEQQAAKGHFFAMTLGLLTMFDRQAPAQVQIHLEPARDKTDQDDPEIIALYQAAGWRYLGIFRKNFFVFVSENLTLQAHSDAAVLDYSSISGGANRTSNRQYTLSPAGDQSL